MFKKIYVSKQNQIIRIRREGITTKNDTFLNMMIDEDKRFERVQLIDQLQNCIFQGTLNNIIVNIYIHRFAGLNFETKLRLRLGIYTAFTLKICLPLQAWYYAWMMVAGSCAGGTWIFAESGGIWILAESGGFPLYAPARWMSHQLSQSWAVRNADAGKTEASLESLPVGHECWHAEHWESSCEPYHGRNGGWLVLKSAYLSRFYIIILHLKYQ